MTDKKPDHNNDFRPERLDVAGLALVNGRLQGSDLLQKYKRLMQETSGDRVDLGSKIKVEWQAQGDQGVQVEGSGATPQGWLHLQAKTHLPQVCQRCLADVDLALEVDRSYRFVVDEATAEAQDDESEEDVLALSREFNLMELIEDELLMALPLVPRHEVCPVQPKMAVSDDDFESTSGDKPNPFAVLGSLKVKKSD
ncbi:MAG: DUF177 domain-containing protein [Burkholderiaceae bacterium]|nr:DUF177 domain-containing protein [Burkholderiaceae bacterium]